jgi:hypothetical protein
VLSRAAWFDRCFQGNHDGVTEEPEQDEVEGVDADEARANDGAAGDDLLAPPSLPGPGA